MRNLHQKIKLFEIQIKIAEIPMKDWIKIICLQLKSRILRTAVTWEKKKNHNPLIIQNMIPPIPTKFSEGGRAIDLVEKRGRDIKFNESYKIFKYL